MNKYLPAFVICFPFILSSCKERKKEAIFDVSKQIEQMTPTAKAGRFNDERQRYTNSSKNAYIENKQLVIKAIHESDKHGMDQYSSARLNTANKQTWKYGKIAARIKLPYGKGIWPAFWMLGANIDENGGDMHWKRGALPMISTSLNWNGIKKQ